MPAVIEPYDDNNIFARILRGELPCRSVYEDEQVFAFHDVHPEAPVHVLVIPKGKYVSYDDFVASSSDLAAFFRAVGVIARRLGLAQVGYKLVTNHGKSAGQVIPHFHVHILGGY
ncbi:MAG: HIT domain-containing protein [Anaplasma sp.]